MSAVFTQIHFLFESNNGLCRAKPCNCQNVYLWWEGPVWRHLAQWEWSCWCWGSAAWHNWQETSLSVSFSLEPAPREDLSLWLFIKCTSTTKAAMWTVCFNHYKPNRCLLKKKKKPLRILQSSWTFGGIGDFSCIIPVSVMVLSAVCLCVCVWSADVAIVEKLMLWSDEHTSAHKNIDIHVRIISWSTIDWVDGALFICVSCKLHPTFFGWDFKQNSSLMTKYVSDLREGFSV